MISNYIIAEVAQSHEGALGIAHSFIDAAATAGADAIKFQTHLAEEESSIHEKFRIKMSNRDKTRYDYWDRTSFAFDEWQGLLKHSQEKNINFSEWIKSSYLPTPTIIEASKVLYRNHNVMPQVYLLLR